MRVDVVAMADSRPFALSEGLLRITRLAYMLRVVITADREREVEVRLCAVLVLDFYLIIGKPFRYYCMSKMLSSLRRQHIGHSVERAYR